jgi:hypothetical protein
MIPNFAVQHYLHLREQGLSHERAFYHACQRFGVRIDDLREQLADARRVYLASAAMIPASLTEPDSRNGRPER